MIKMKAVNLYLLTRNRDKKFYTPYENVLSGRDEMLKVKEHEFDNLIHLVDILWKKGVTVGELEGFYYGYKIRQIGKEFDLLKISDNNQVLNVELKSQQVSEEKIKKQLLKNQYYLSCVAPKLHLFTFVDETGSLYTLEEEELRLCDFDELLGILCTFKEFENGDIDTLFRAQDYLISPLNMPQKFVENRYFLTQQQDTMKKEILSEIMDGGRASYWGITGMAGTGKTLLLYDMAKACAGYGRCCIVHGGMLSDGHALLNVLLDNIDIIAECEMDHEDLLDYGFLFVDEAQRMSEEKLADIVEITEENRIPCVFSYDYFQTLSKTEQRRNIPGKLKQLAGFQERKLSGRIRSNEEMSSFIRTLLDLNDTEGKVYRYDAVDVAFAADMEEAKYIVSYYANEKQYTFIEYGKPQKSSELLEICKSGYCTEDVIGQEFERVVITLDDKFRYNEDGKLQGKNHPNPDYIYDRLFFQAVSRTRERLCIVIIGNRELFEHITFIKYRRIFSHL